MTPIPTRHPSAPRIGAWSRPWSPFGLETALEHIKATGFSALGLMTAGVRDDGRGSRYVIEPEDGEAHIARVEQLVRASGLDPVILLTRSRFREREEATGYLRRSIDIARRLGAPYLLTGGTSRPEEYETFFEVVAAAIDYARQSGVQLLMKPHGGLSATAAECVAAVTRIDSSHFGICWDPGNVYAYAKTPPEEGFAAAAPYVRVVCLKDTPPPDQETPARPMAGGPGRSWWVRPGLGIVDWRYQFGVLRDHGFSGPCLFETLPGTTIEDIDAAAVASRRHFEDLTASLQS